MRRCMRGALLVVCVLLVATFVMGCVSQQGGGPTQTQSEQPQSIPTSTPIPTVSEQAAGMKAERASGELAIWMPYSTHYVRSGGSGVFTMSVRNTAKQQRTIEFVPVMYEQSGYQSSVDPAWVSVSPSRLTLDAGQSAVLSITVSPPEGTPTGYYRGMLALRSSAFPEQLRYYSIYVYEPLTEPITKQFKVVEGTEAILAVVSWNEFEGVNSNVTVRLVSPEGVPHVGTERSEISGWIGEGARVVESTSVSHTTRIYVRNPMAGTWTLEMMPEVAAGISFRVMLNPTQDTLKSYGVEG